MERKRFKSLGSGILFAVLAAGLLAASSAQATLTYSGDVSPADPSTWTSSTDAYVGNTANGSLDINGGSAVTLNRGYLGYSAGTTGTVTVDGSGSSLSSANILSVSYYGNGSLNITNGGSVSNSAGGYLGYWSSSSTGVAYVDGSGSNWTMAGSNYLGYMGTGVLKITNGGHVTSGSMVSIASSGVGILIVDGVGSTYTANGTLNFGIGKSGSVSILDGGTINSASRVGLAAATTRLTVDVGNGSFLKVGSTGTGTLNNNGVIRLVAGAGAANGTYAPISAGTWSGTGTVQALGGVWDATAHTVTVSSAMTGAAGGSLTADLATTQRFLFTDGSTGKSVGAGFQATTSSANLTLTASNLSNSELTSLQSLLGAGQAVLSGWDLNATEGYTAGNPVYLSLFAGSGHSLYDLTVWHYDGSVWSKFTVSDLAYDNTFASFTATGLSGYAVTGAAPVPIPAAAWLLGSGLAGLGIFRRKVVKHS